MTGRQLGIYRIVSLIGAGGMGEVYRARDTRLDRDVAIKVLPASFADDPERVRRFEREAKLLAALNHPNIASIYGAEESSGFLALVLELVEGPTLGERLRGGPMPIREAIVTAIGIAEALEAAHEKGIIHRDLKPANIKLTLNGKVKVLDFGLAKALVGDGVGSDISESPTAVVDATRDGLIAGTIGYMSPEQARGQAVDRRTDIWAFGCVLYEMLTGRATFSRETPSDTIVSILERQPDWRALPSATPQAIRRLLERCLEKDASRRLRDIGDARVELDDTLAERRGGRPPARDRRGLWLGGTVAALIAGAASIYFFNHRGMREPATATAVVASGQSQWVQLTRLADPVSQPALSSDGRMLTFVRGPDTVLGAGDVFVKTLPDGEAVQLTHDGSRKMSPVFSPDDTRIAYTVSEGASQWDTWAVRIAGGSPELWLPNASGLVWLDAHRILFSEILNGDIHMALVSADENRAGERKVYVPAGERDMVHRSWPSPDRRWAVVAEMSRGVWEPCRLVPMDASSVGRPIGPPGAWCLSGAWTPDGNWIYVSSGAGGAFHVWRQRFPDGAPEQVTSGPTEEDGIAMAPDGKSFVTAVGLRESAVWLHDASGDRPVSGEGYACDPRFTRDGRQLLYRVMHGVSTLTDPGELRMMDLASGRTESVLPGVAVYGQPGRAYDVSPDGRTLVVATHDAQDRPRLWIAPVDRRFSPHQIPNVEGSQPYFAEGGDVLFWRTEESAAYVYRVHPDGTGLRKVTDSPVAGLNGVTNDGRWFVTKLPHVGGASMVGVPLADGSQIRLTTDSAAEAMVKWSADGRSSFWTLYPTAGSRTTYVIPLEGSRTFPAAPTGGFASAAEFAKIPGVRVIASADVAPGPAIDTYAYTRETVQRNLYRVPTP